MVSFLAMLTSIVFSASYVAVFAGQPALKFWLAILDILIMQALLAA
jgi:hypothetical protein